MEHYEDRALLAVIEEVNTTLNGLVWGTTVNDSSDRDRGCI